MKIKRLVTSLVMLLALVTATLAADKKPDDDFIYDSVREKLATDIVVKGGAIDVDVKDGVVTLKGHVQESKQKSKAESLAKKVKGVKSVVNNIQIVPQ
jgi:hyperosmotically inducible periplasmic protein